ncbi:hypothetical protein HYX18_01370 [Candidatus Woesearchaeota archaeon]|nr:hypothetical protein [Candidatus Woesearchaeota archaeon]
MVSVHDYSWVEDLIAYSSDPFNISPENRRDRIDRAYYVLAALVDYNKNGLMKEKFVDYLINIIKKDYPEKKEHEFDIVRMNIERIINDENIFG